LATCFKITGMSVNVRDAPCGNVIGSLSLNTVVTASGSPQPKSPCSVGSYQWQQITAPKAGYVATTLLASTSCSSTPPPPPPPPANGWHGHGVDVSSPCANWACIRQSYSYAVVRMYRESSGGSVDPNGAASVRAAAAAGLSVDVYLYPAGTHTSDGRRMATDTLNAIRGLPVGRVWVDVEGVTSSWSSNKANNQQLFKDIVDTLRAGGAQIGIYTQGWQWNAIFGSTFTYGANYPLWYAVYGQGPGHYTTTDGVCSYSGASQSFSDFSAFGGWSRPFAKQYNGNCVKCGCSTDANWAP